jgi:protoporphyrinogen IX oxidase
MLPVRWLWSIGRGRVSRWLAGAYPWIKSVHIVSIIAWLAGLLYLPRLFVYHATVPVESSRSAVFKTMERRLLQAIMTPAMLASWTFGLMLAATPGVLDWHRGWIWAKFALVIGLTVYHAALGRWRRLFAIDRNGHSARFFRIVNELPTVAMIAIVILVVVKPF